MAYSAIITPLPCSVRLKTCREGKASSQKAYGHRRDGWMSELCWLLAFFTPSEEDTKPKPPAIGVSEGSGDAPRPAVEPSPGVSQSEEL